MQIFRDEAYDAYVQFSHAGREYKPRSKEWWSRDLRKILDHCVSDERPRANNAERKRVLTFRSISECRTAYGEFVHAHDIEWQPVDEPETDTPCNNSARHVTTPRMTSPTLQGDSLPSQSIREMPAGTPTALKTAAAVAAADLAFVRSKS